MADKVVASYLIRVVARRSSGGNPDAEPFTAKLIAETVQDHLSMSTRNFVFTVRSERTDK